MDDAKYVAYLFFKKVVYGFNTLHLIPIPSSFLLNRRFKKDESICQQQNSNLCAESSINFKPIVLPLKHINIC